MTSDAEARERALANADFFRARRDAEVIYGGGLADDLIALADAFAAEQERTRRLEEPYHECVSLTYMPEEQALEALLRIRRRLKTAIGWWTEHDEELERAALDSAEADG